ncbi:hypothetical protein Shyd_94080 [Streptomyces hydrogenans]|uniref:Dihydrodipicolinate synthase family protein n=1 Tax=Streptomyces hydrogenans TaxID=1873719 RepID=A0ABQ3PSN1_9ACTN|nr:dihydrodipicolinate synthase family protein [Streptomyces hydrogenans]GHI28037.1 hypothetical protein Shyd_94080 [Streptomyces hydrogenans]
MTDTRTRPWHGIMVATTLPLREDLSVDLDAYAEHVRWLIANGCDGVVPNGSLGEYQTLTDAERAAVVHTAVAAAGDGARVMAGVAAYGSAESRRWAEQAAEAGAGSVLLLPPKRLPRDEEAVRAHYAEVARAGPADRRLQQPIDTKVDLTPALLARLHADGTSSPSRSSAATSAAPTRSPSSPPGSTILIGADDVLLELAIAGAVGWIAGYPNALPESAATLYRAAVAGDLTTAAPALQVPAQPLPLGLQDRVRPGHQALHGPRGPPRRTHPRPAPAAHRRRRGRRPRRPPRRSWPKDSADPRGKTAHAHPTRLPRGGLPHRGHSPPGSSPVEWG